MASLGADSCELSLQSTPRARQAAGTGEQPSDRRLPEISGSMAACNLRQASGKLPEMFGRPPKMFAAREAHREDHVEEPEILRQQLF